MILILCGNLTVWRQFSTCFAWIVLHLISFHSSRKFVNRVILCLFQSLDVVENRSINYSQKLELKYKLPQVNQKIVSVRVALSTPCSFMCLFSNEFELVRAEINSNALSTRCYLYKNSNYHWICNLTWFALSFSFKKCT